MGLGLEAVEHKNSGSEQAGQRVGLGCGTCALCDLGQGT